jgi:hypothetical protein
VNPFSSRPEYEAYIYGLPARYRLILSSTLVAVRRSAAVVIVKGEVHFAAGFRLSLIEYSTFHAGPGIITGYSYEVWQGATKLYWYDSQAHPHDPTLASTHPHHEHIPPDIKHNRIPAPGLSFTQPNLPLLIQEIEQLLQSSVADAG